MIEDKNCWNCLHEYLCSWEPAGDEWSCPEWQPEKRAEEKMDEENKIVSLPERGDSDLRFGADGAGL
jgi:hypothetical protein|nr:MAG TPA: hypothetical protein [Caudoviricetes sp.]